MREIRTHGSEIVQLLSLGFAGVYCVLFEAIKSEQVLSEDEQSGLGSSELQTTTVEASEPSVRFCVGEP